MRQTSVIFLFTQNADGGELRCETSGFETRTRNVCEEKFETECKTIQVLNQNQLGSFYLTLPIFSTENENGFKP